MYISNSSDNITTFGWKSNLHPEITKRAARSLKLYRPYVEQVVNAVAQPANDEVSLFGRKRYYFPNKDKHSFLDSKGFNNAKAAYMEHLARLRDFLTLKQRDNAIEEAGRALYYLQEITQPFHVKKGSMFKKLFERFVYGKKFDNYVADNKEAFLRFCIPSKMNNADDLETLFDETARLSLENKLSGSNHKNWVEAARNGINLAVDSTSKFLQLVAENMHY